MQTHLGQKLGKGNGDHHAKQEEAIE